MKKLNKTKLALNKETITALEPSKLTNVVGGGYTATGTMCESCTYKSARIRCIIMAD